MLKIILSFLIFTSSAYGEVDFVTVKACKNLIMGSILSTEGVQTSINEKLRDALNAAKAKEVYFIKYGTETGLLRVKSNGCIIATGWFSK